MLPGACGSGIQRLHILSPILAVIVFRACWGVPCRFGPLLIQRVVVRQDLVPVGTGVMMCACDIGFGPC